MCVAVKDLHAQWNNSASNARARMQILRGYRAQPVAQNDAPLLFSKKRRRNLAFEL
jgi:hypothetical protein